MKQICISAFFICALLVVALPERAFAQAAPSPATPSQAASSVESKLEVRLPVVKEVLENGLTVLLLQDRSIPMVSYHTWYRVGSRDEGEGITGAAHMLEHMMFKGSKKYPGKTFDRLMHENGIQHNAFTTYDYTGFYMNLPSSKLEMIMEIEVDRMTSLILDPKDLLSEREVVKEERRWRVDNNPNGLLRELAMSTIFKSHPYRWPVIGHMKDIAAYEVATLRSFYETYYVPNNAVLVIAGDFDLEKTKALVRKHYGPLQRKTLPPRERAPEPPQKTQYNAKLKWDVQATSFMVAFRGRPVGDDKMYALDLAAVILGGGGSSRLEKALVMGSQTALSAWASHSSLRDDGVFSVMVAMKPGVDMNSSLEAVYRETFRLRNKVVSEDELRKAKTLAMKSLVDSLTSMDGKARALAASEIMTGSYEDLFRDLQKYEAVTAEQIRQVSAEFFNQTQRSIIVLEPKASAQAANAGGEQ